MPAEDDARQQAARIRPEDHRLAVEVLNEEAVAAAVTAAGEDPYERKLLGLTAMKALLGKKRFDDILGRLTFKPPGKPTLVPETDSRLFSGVCVLSIITK